MLPNGFDFGPRGRSRDQFDAKANRDQAWHQSPLLHDGGNDYSCPEVQPSVAAARPDRFMNNDLDVLLQNTCSSGPYRRVDRIRIMSNSGN